MRITGFLKRLLASKRAAGGAAGRRSTRLPRLDDLEFNVIPATEDHIYDQDVRPALLAQILASERSR